MGVGPITHVEIKAWTDLKRIDITPYEVDALRAIDKEYLIYQNSDKSKAE